MPPRRTACRCGRRSAGRPRPARRGDRASRGRVGASRGAAGLGLEGPLDSARREYRLPAGVDAAAPLYLGGKLLHAGTADSVERADGRATAFSFDDASGPIVVGDRVLVPGRDYQAKGDKVTFAQAPPFNAEVRRITGDYAVLDPAKGLVALARPASVRPRVGHDAVRLAERLSGAVDGSNRTFTFAHAPVVDTDPSRQVYVDGTACLRRRSGRENASTVSARASPSPLPAAW